MIHPWRVLNDLRLEPANGCTVCQLQIMRSSVPTRPERLLARNIRLLSQQGTVTRESPHAHIHVVAAVIRQGNAVLIGCRPEAKKHGGLWEFPGGKVDQNETVAEAIVRELREELLVEATAADDPIFSVIDELSEFQISFIPTKIQGEPVALEHSAILWCNVDQLLEYPLAPSDRAFSEYLIRMKQ